MCVWIKKFLTIQTLTRKWPVDAKDTELPSKLDLYFLSPEFAIPFAIVTLRYCGISLFWVGAKSLNDKNQNGLNLEIQNYQSLNVERPLLQKTLKY